MQRLAAEQIVTWTYPPPYTFYNFHNTIAEVTDLLNGDCFVATEENGDIIGFICYNQSAQVPGGIQAGIYDTCDVVDIGLGLRPDLAGMGLGLSFLYEAMAFFRRLTDKHSFRLVVAKFNERAIKVYERAGFVNVKEFTSPVQNEEVTFICMIRPQRFISNEECNNETAHQKDD